MICGLPTPYDQIDHSAIPEVVCVDGMDGCTNYKTQWQCPKSDREKTMLIVRQTFSKKLHQLSNTGNKPARRKRVCEQHTDTQRWGQTPKESTYYIPVTGLLLLQVFRE
jgi:hypothetical protein